MDKTFWTHSMPEVASTVGYNHKGMMILLMHNFKFKIQEPNRKKTLFYLIDAHKSIHNNSISICVQTYFFIINFFH